MNPHGDPTAQEARERAEAADRHAARDRLIDITIGLILLMLAVGAVVLGPRVMT